MQCIGQFVSHHNTNRPAGKRDPPPPDARTISFLPSFLLGKTTKGFVVTGASRHDVAQLDHVLRVIMVKRKTPTIGRSKHLCADARYRGQPALEIIKSLGYIAHVVDRRKEADAKRRDPTKKARRWVVEGCHQLVQPIQQAPRWPPKLPTSGHPKFPHPERSFVALNHIAAAIIAFRKVKLFVN